MFFYCCSFFFPCLLLVFLWVLLQFSPLVFGPKNPLSSSVSWLPSPASALFFFVSVPCVIRLPLVLCFQCSSSCSFSLFSYLPLRFCLRFSAPVFCFVLPLFSSLVPGLPPLLLCSALPFIEPESLKTSPVFAGLLFKSRTGSWAGDVVHDLLQISC